MKNKNKKWKWIVRKNKLHMLQNESYIWQKLQGMKLKDRNWKRKERHLEIHDNNTNKTSTKRVRKHKENKRLIVPVPFQLPRSTWKSRWHSSIIKKRSPATPNSETNAHINVLNSQYPNTRTNVALISWENLIWQRIMISNENVINLAISHEI